MSGGHDEDEGEGEGEDPFDGLDDSLRNGPGDPFDDLETVDGADETAFESVDVDDVSIDRVWDAIEGGETTESPDVGGEDVAIGEPAESVDDGEHLVPKAAYCERCPYLAAPPDLACDHEGTTIVAVEDDEQFRVRDCPMVERGGVSEE